MSFKLRKRVPKKFLVKASSCLSFCSRAKNLILYLFQVKKIKREDSAA